MYHSIYFGDGQICNGSWDGFKNTWDDWFLIPSSRPVFNPPNQKTIYIDIPGSDGSLDLSESLTGWPIYENRTGSLEFIVDHNHNDYVRWSDTYSKICNYLHGQKMKAILEDEPEYYYEGRFAVKEWRSESDYSRITIDYNVYPYKLERVASNDSWLWDPFNFENGVIREYNALEILAGEVYNITVVGSRRPVVPEFDVVQLGVGPFTMTYNGKTYQLKNGSNIFHDIVLFDNRYNFVFTNTGSNAVYVEMSIVFRGGSL